MVTTSFNLKRELLNILPNPQEGYSTKNIAKSAVLSLAAITATALIYQAALPTIEGVFALTSLYLNINNKINTWNDLLRKNDTPLLENANNFFYSFCNRVEKELISIRSFLEKDEIEA